MKPLRLLLLAPALWIAALVGCGGGSDPVAGVGGGGTGYAQGVGSGFGSVYVDGDRWHDSGATVEFEADPRGAAVPAQLKLGQQMLIEYRTDGVADRIRLEAEVIGRVQATTPELRVAGQIVRVNTNADLGPVTVFGGGYNAAADIVTNDPIEVHGSSRFDTVLNRYVIQASRIDRLSGLPANLTRVTGIITGLQTTPGITAISFQLGDLAVNVTAATNGGPAGRTLANGQRVVVWGTTITGGATPTLTADALRIRDTMPSAGGKPSQVAGVASRWNAAAGTLEVNGFRVNAAGAIVVPANQSIADGSYVIVRGSFDAANVLVAEQVRIRKRLPNQGEVDLVGAIQNFVSIGNFELRGVRVDASGVNVPGNCNPANGVAVTVSGTIVNNVVVAERLRCN